MESADSTTEMFQNEQIRFTVHHKPACIIEFDVEALEPLMATSHKHAVKAVAKVVSLPGFRKGKAPDALIIKNYPKEIEKEWQQKIADQALQQCLQLSKIPLLHRDSQVSYKMKNFSNAGALLSLTFETEPTIPKVDPKLVQLKTVSRPEVNEEKINETIRQVQLFFAQWKTVENRPIQEGDYVLLDVDVIEETPHTPLFSKTRFEVTERSMAKWMRELVMGKKAGDVLEGISIPDEDASKEDKETLQPKKVRLTILAVDTATLPVMDETFINQLGASSEEDLREKVTRLLNAQADMHVREAQRKQVSDFLLVHYAFELPASLIEKETRFRLNQLIQDLDFKKYWSGLSQEKGKELVLNIYEQSKKAVQMFYLCRQIVNDAHIQISTNDIPPPVTEPIEYLLNPQKFFHHERNPEIEHAEAFSRLVLEKAEDYVVANASMTGEKVEETPLAN